MYLDISFLRPKSQQFLNKHSSIHTINLEYYIKSGTDGMIVRNIYEKVDYEEYELKLIEEFKSKITQTLPNQWKTSDYLKLLISADFQIPQALQNLQIHLNWLNQYATVPLDLRYLEKGDFYIFGIDKQSRPVLIIRNLDNDNFAALQYLLETVKRQVLVPYYVENWTIIFDSQNQEINLYEVDLNYENIQQLMINFCGNLNNILIVNSQLKLQQVLNLIPNKVQIHSKIKILTNLNDLQQYIPTEQLEEKFGGECSNVSTYWPPSVPKISEFLKHVTLDCYEDYQQGLKKLQDFRGRNLKKFSSLGRMSHSHTNTRTASMRKSVESISSSSHLKIIVREENGNQLIQEEIDLGNNHGDSAQGNQKEEIQENTQALFLKEIQQKERTQSLSLNQKVSQQQLQVILEDETAVDNHCCSRQNCQIF